MDSFDLFSGGVIAFLLALILLIGVLTWQSNAYEYDMTKDCLARVEHVEECRWIISDD